MFYYGYSGVIFLLIIKKQEYVLPFNLEKRFHHATKLSSNLSKCIVWQISAAKRFHDIDYHNFS